MFGDYIAFDLETTGLNPDRDAIIEIGAARFHQGEVVERYQTLVNPGKPIPSEITHLTGIDDDDVAAAPRMHTLLPRLRAFFGKTTIIGHNVSFDVGFMQKHKLLADNPALDTYELAAILLPAASRYNLGSLASQMGVELKNAHRAYDDAEATGRLYWQLWRKLRSLPSGLLAEIIRLSSGQNWTLRSLWQEALRESLRTAEATPPWQEPFAADAYASEGADSAAPALDTTVASRKPLDLPAVAQVFDEAGALAAQHEHYEMRPQQIAMAREVAAALNSGGQLLIEAGTGTGKSLAYLIPAAGWALQNGNRVTIATNTINLQEQLLKQDIPLTRQVVGKGLRAALMKGRNNYLCPRRLTTLRRRKPANRDELRSLAKILVWLHEGGAGDRGAITLRGAEWQVWSRLSAQDEGCTSTRCATEMAGVCPFHRARKQAEAAHIVITNHALLVADAAVDNRALPAYHNLVVDEAHHLEAAITTGMSRHIDQRSLLGRLSDIVKCLNLFLGAARKHFPPAAASKLSDFVQTISQAIAEMRQTTRGYFRALTDFLASQRSDHHYGMRLTQKQRDSGGFASVQSAWQQLAAYLLALTEALERLAKALPRYAQYGLPEFADYRSEIRGHWRYIAELHEQLERFTDDPDSKSVYGLKAGRRTDSLQLTISPLHVGPMMDEYLSQRLESIVLTSATLRAQEQFEHIKERLYVEDYRELALGSPFDYRSSTLLFVPDNMPEPGKRSGYQRMLERGIIELATALNGRVMALFTSYAQLRETALHITPRLKLGDIEVFDQSFGGGREALLEGFKRADRAVLMGVRSFWEGIDIPGDDLSALVIVRLPFAVPSEPIFAARAETYSNSFMQYAVPDAILRFRQGFGRLIRSRSDRGIVAIFDSRVLSKNYGASFLESLPECSVQFAALDKLPSLAKAWIERP
ncbi:MAG: exonuclease domain-containing protein [Chloroflexi bacterium]|nr:exonuclease domain-containing protein [Chloroflexota bacterium]MYA94515.1 DEAD/DEAH box helicase [Chloroflexota bacterium]MYC55565.1 DEAD/DEAH box helicase [Chloroflexota bacterium]MYD39051.1 DEAD/DEAH box helicase [Chloroflexota bacterium]MYE79710.1 DEAD/DEAH box helicase [Chloroflexota bacterium]